VPDQSPADLVVHPVRLRLLTTIAGRRLTARQLLAELGTVPQATLYYHLGLLTEAGFLRVVEERPVRGTVERVYALGQSPILSAADLQNATVDAHRRYFIMFLAALLEEFAQYLEHPPGGTVDLGADGVGYRQEPMNLSDSEFRQMVQALNQTLLPFLAHAPGPGRSRRLFTTVFIPAARTADPLQETAPPVSYPIRINDPLLPTES
jgi:DNA-binding transcriptional ArsR family regulator